MMSGTFGRGKSGGSGAAAAGYQYYNETLAKELTRYYVYYSVLGS